MRAISGSTCGSKPKFVEQFKSAAGSAFGQNFGEFVAQPFRRDDQNLRRESANGRGGLRLNREIKARGESHGADKPQFIFFEAPLGIADSANDPRAQIGAAVDVIEDFVGARIEQQAVDGEIAAQDIFLRRWRENDAVGMPPVGIADVRAESSNFNFGAAFGHENHAELRADRQRIGK